MRHLRWFLALFIPNAPQGFLVDIIGQLAEFGAVSRRKVICRTSARSQATTRAVRLNKKSLKERYPDRKESS